MTRKESLIYRRNCPYDAMGDYSVLFGERQGEPEDRKDRLKRTEAAKGPVLKCR